MTAPELSAREREIVARFEAAKYPPEVLRERNLLERVADAIAMAPVHLQNSSGRNTRDAQRILARAAIDAMRGES